MFTRAFDSVLMCVNERVRFVLCERLIERIEVVVGAPVADAVGELCCEQITSAGGQGEQVVVRITLVVQSTYGSDVLSARSSRRESHVDVADVAMLEARGLTSLGLSFMAEPWTVDAVDTADGNDSVDAIDAVDAVETALLV